MGRYALLVGVNEYESGDLNLPEPLRYAEADASEFARALEQTCLFDETLVLPGREATFERLGTVLERGCLRERGARIGAGDQFLFFFAGHGELLMPSCRFVVHPWNAMPHSGVHSFSAEQVMDFLERHVGAGQCMCVLDACRNYVSQAGAREAAVFDEKGSRDVALAVGKVREKVVQVLFACREGERSYELPEYGHGVLTHFLLDSLADLLQERSRGDRGVTFTDLMEETGEKMSSWAHPRSGATQRPRFFGDPARIVIAPGEATAEPQTEPAPPASAPPKAPAAAPPVRRPAPGKVRTLEQVQEEVERRKRETQARQRARRKEKKLRAERLARAIEDFEKVTAGRHGKAMANEAWDAILAQFSLVPGSVLVGDAMALRYALGWSEFGDCIATLLGHQDWLTSAVFSRDGQTLATGSADNSARLWSVPDGKCIATLSGHEDRVTSVAFSPDGRVLATDSTDRTVRLWSVPDGGQVATLPRKKGYHSHVAFSPDGRVLAMGSDNKTARLWSLPEGKYIATLLGHGGWFRSGTVFCVAFSPDGRLLATGSADRTVRFWSVPEGKHVATLSGHPNGVTYVAFSPDGRILATGSRDRTGRFWSVPDGRHLANLSVCAAEEGSVAFSPDGCLFATSDDQNTASLWSVPDGRNVAYLFGHTQAVTAVAFSPGGRVLATGSMDGTARLWSVPDGKHLATLSVDALGVLSIAFTPDGRFLATASSTARLWYVGRGEKDEP